MDWRPGRPAARTRLLGPGGEGLHVSSERLMCAGPHQPRRTHARPGGVQGVLATRARHHRAHLSSAGEAKLLKPINRYAVRSCGGDTRASSSSSWSWSRLCRASTSAKAVSLAAGAELLKWLPPGPAGPALPAVRRRPCDRSVGRGDGGSPHSRPRRPSRSAKAISLAADAELLKWLPPGPACPAASAVRPIGGAWRRRPSALKASVAEQNC